jgi:ribulose-phosphate 3-epimerase
MGASICPTITTNDPAVYTKQIEQTLSYAHRIHIDLSDGFFTTKLIEIEDVWWPGGVRADLHVMYQRPFDHVEALVALRPQLIIVHAEAEGDFRVFADRAHQYGIEVGVAMLPDTSVESILPALDCIDHVLIFSGHLGRFGGHADLGLLDKVKQLKEVKPRLEIGWDGGIDDQNAVQLVRGGVDVLNAGGFLHGAVEPQVAYATLRAAIEE